MSPYEPWQPEKLKAQNVYAINQSLPDLLQQFLPSLQKTRSEHLKVHQHILLFEEAPAFRLYQRYIL